MKMNKLLLIISCFIISSCVSHPIANLGLVLPEYTVPYDPATAAQIDIGRSGFTGSAFIWDLYLDDIFVVENKAKSAISVKINPGEHIFCYRPRKWDECKNLYNPIDLPNVTRAGRDRNLITLEPNQRICYKYCEGFGCTGWDGISCKLWDEEFGDRKKYTKVNY